MLKTLNINCSTIDTEKDEKGTNCNVSKDNLLWAGGEQCCANTEPERSCVKTDSNTSCYTKRENNSNSNNRSYNAFLSMANNEDIECPLPSPSRETNINNEGNSYIFPLPNNNEIKYFLPGPSRESDNVI